MTTEPGWLTFRMPLEFTDDPAAFLDATRDHLAADPVQTTVIATVTARYAAGTGSPAPYRWWVIARDGRRLASADLSTVLVDEARSCRVPVDGVRDEGRPLLRVLPR